MELRSDSAWSDRLLLASPSCTSQEARSSLLLSGTSAPRLSVGTRTSVPACNSSRATDSQTRARLQVCCIHCMHPPLHASTACIYHCIPSLHTSTTAYIHFCIHHCMHAPRHRCRQYFMNAPFLTCTTFVHHCIHRCLSTSCVPTSPARLRSENRRATGSPHLFCCHNRRYNGSGWSSVAAATL